MTLDIGALVFLVANLLLFFGGITSKNYTILALTCLALYKTVGM